jgi:hypothetical protein
VDRVAEVTLGGEVVGVAIEAAGRDDAGGFGEGDGLPVGVDTRGEEMKGVGGGASGEESCDETGYSEGGYFYEAADETAGLARGHKGSKGRNWIQKSNGYSEIQKEQQLGGG